MVSLFSPTIHTLRPKFWSRNSIIDKSYRSSLDTVYSWLYSWNLINRHNANHPPSLELFHPRWTARANFPIFIFNIQFNIYIYIIGRVNWKIYEQEKATRTASLFPTKLSTPPSIYIPTLFQYSSSSTTSCSIHLFAYLEFIASFQVCRYIHRAAGKLSQLFRGRRIVVRYSVNFSTVHFLHFPQNWKQASKLGRSVIDSLCFQMLANVFLIRVHRAPIRVRDLYLSEISSTRKIITRERSRSLQFLLPSTFYLPIEREGGGGTAS